jgi:RNA polymerase sigma factor (sigma-70 family)
MELRKLGICRMSEEAKTKPIAMYLQAQWPEQIKRLDPEAWDLLLMNHAVDLRHDILISLRKRRLPEELVDDIEQETWVTAVRKMAEFVWEDEDKFYHWLRAISLNHVHTYRRVMGRYPAMADLHEEDIDEDLERFPESWNAASGRESVEDEVILREQMSALDRAMRTLKPHEREILLRWLMGERPRELALAYQMKPRSVSMLLLRAKGKIEENIAYLQSLKAKDKDDDRSV